jgi:hypothetical protein
MFLGDIVLFEGQAKAMYEHALHQTDRRQKRTFIGPAPRRWDVRRPIEYSFDGSHSRFHSVGSRSCPSLYTHI